MPPFEPPDPTQAFVFRGPIATHLRCESSREIRQPHATSSEAFGQEPLWASLNEALSEVGGVQSSLVRLLRAVEHGDNRPRSQACEGIYQAIAVRYGLLGHDDDASEWLKRACPQRVRPEDARTYLKTAILKAFLGYLAGHYSATIRLANSLLRSFGHALTGLPRDLLIGIMGFAYLRLGQLSKAQRCVDAMSTARRKPCDHPAAFLGFLLEGEIHLWLLIRSASCFRGQILFADTAGNRALDRAFHCRAARLAFEHARACVAENQLLEQIALSGVVRARLLLQPNQGDRDWLERHIRFLDHRGLTHERDLARLNLSVLLLMQGRAQEARAWLHPLARSTMLRAGTPLEYEVLFCAAVAARGSGEPQQGLAYLSEYNARMCAQHLSHVCLPAPQLHQQALPDTPVSPSTLTDAHYESALATRVAMQIRSQPAAPAHPLQLAAIEGISRRTLEYRIRQATGHGPKEFVTRLRLDVATERMVQLESGDVAALHCIAKETGFASYRTFLRAFRSAYGRAPSQIVLTPAAGPAPFPD